MQIEKEEFHRLFEAHPQPMLVYDTASLQILDANEAALAEYGYSREEFLERTILDLHPPEDRPGMEEVLEPMRSGSYRGFRKITKAMRNVRKDGSLFEIESAGQPVVFEGHEARVIVVQDVTDRRRARMLQERYEALFEKTRDVVLFIATDGRIVDANRAALRAYGYSLASLAVIARGSSTPFKKTKKTQQQIAEELDVGYLLTGTIRWEKSAGRRAGPRARASSSRRCTAAGTGRPSRSRSARSAWRSPASAC